MAVTFTASINPTVGGATKVSEILAAFNNTLYLLTALIPVGAALDYFGSALPAGPDGEVAWLWADGSVVSQTTYAALYAAIGTTYNTGGEGAGNFRLPDRRGRASIGAGTGSGLTARTLGQQIGAETVVLDVTEIPSHHHSYTEISTGSPKAADGGAGYDLVTGAGSGSTGSTGGGLGHANVQPSLVCNVIIRTGL